MKRFPRPTSPATLPLLRTLLAGVGLLLAGAGMRTASAADAEGRLLLELTPEAARDLRHGLLEIPLPPGAEFLRPRLVPMFHTEEGPLGRFALLTFDPEASPGRSDVPRRNRKWLDVVRGSPRVRKAASDQVRALAALPDDPVFGDQIHLYNPGGLSVEAVRAWPFVPADGEVVVAVLDSGVRWQHPDLGGEAFPPDGVFWRNEAERNGLPGVDDDGNGWDDDFFGWDFVDVAHEDTLGNVSVHPSEDGETPDNDPGDFQGHGTRVTGLVTALTNNGTCIAGMPAQVRIMPLRVGWMSSSGAGFVFMSYCAQALEYAALNGAQVANCSWDSDTTFGMAAALDFAIGEHDMVVVGSAGNHSNSSTSIEYLSSREDCLGVAGILPWGTKLGSSNFGTWVDIAAFAQGMASTTYDGVPDSTGCEIIRFGGTSFAAPIVTAEAALLRMVDPAAPAAVIRDLVRTTGRDLHDVEPGYADLLGGGLADYAAAVQALGGGWDGGLGARSLTPFGTATTPVPPIAFFASDTLFVTDGTDGTEIPGWVGGFPGMPEPAGGVLPLAVSWGTHLAATVIWSAADNLYAANDAGQPLAGWPVQLPSGSGQPLAVRTVAAGEVVFVPTGDDVLRLEVGVDPAPSATPLGWPAVRLAAGQLDGDLDPEVVGIDSAGVLRVWEEGEEALAGWTLPLGPIQVGPVLVELERAGEGWIAAGGPDTLAPDQRQILHLVGPGGSPHREVSLDAPPLTALSAAGFHLQDRVVIVAVDEGGGVHLIDAAGAVTRMDAGGPVAGEALCADLDGDWSADLLVAGRNGTLLAWSADLQPLAGFPRVFPCGFGESPLVIDGSTERFVAIADTAGALWSLPFGPAERPAPWPAARGGRLRNAFLGHDRATPVEPASATLAWAGARPCWSGTGLATYGRLRLREDDGDRILWEGPSRDEGCAESDATPGATLVLEGASRVGAWDILARGLVPALDRLRVEAPTPNPFRSGSMVRWSGAEEVVTIEIFDVQGRSVLAVERRNEQGSFLWEGRDATGRVLPGGLYFLRLREGAHTEVRRLVKVP